LVTYLAVCFDLIRFLQLEVNYVGCEVCIHASQPT